MAVSGVGNQVSSSYERLASMRQINRAADNAAGLSIVNRMESQVNGYDTGTDNALTGQDLINTADGALGSITDSLQRIRELSVQASNGIYSSSDRQAMQDEVQGLLDDIQHVARSTEFNTLNLLDGSMATLDLATNPDGTGMSIQMENATLSSLGIAGYDVTGNFDIRRIDAALETVTSARASLGANSNAIAYAVNANQAASENLTSASSRIEDLDVEKEIMELKKNQVLEEYKTFAQKAREEQEKRQANLLTNL